jgi:hypothetical protein
MTGSTGPRTEADESVEPISEARGRVGEIRRPVRGVSVDELRCIRALDSFGAETAGISICSKQVGSDRPGHPGESSFQCISMVAVGFL